MFARSIPIPIEKSKVDVFGVVIVVSYAVLIERASFPERSCQKLANFSYIELGYGTGSPGTCSLASSSLVPFTSSVGLRFPLHRHRSHRPPRGLCEQNIKCIVRSFISAWKRLSNFPLFLRDPSRAELSSLHPPRL